MNCCIFPYRLSSGPTNMAIDEAMLESVADDPTSSMLRTYGWTEPTLSLGYFQEIAKVEGDPRWRGVPVVRRQTGGGAIWHDREVTYALAIPASYPLARPNTALYHAVHGAIASILRSRGVDVAPRGADADPRPTERPFLCFLDRDPEDLVSGGIKIVGSAQRRRRGAILQHGSLLLGRSPTTPELAGVADLASVPRDPSSWSDLLTDRLPAALGFAPTAGTFDDALLARSGHLEESIYSNPSWTRRR